MESYPLLRDWMDIGLLVTGVKGLSLHELFCIFSFLPPLYVTYQTAFMSVSEFLHLCHWGGRSKQVTMKLHCQLGFSPLQGDSSAAF